jgi:hypothetical protein
VPEGMQSCQTRIALFHFMVVFFVDRLPFQGLPGSQHKPQYAIILYR